MAYFFNKCPSCGYDLKWYDMETAEPTGVCDHCGSVYDSHGDRVFPQQPNNGLNNDPEYQNSSLVRKASKDTGKLVKTLIIAAAAFLAIPALVLIVCIVFSSNKSKPVGGPEETTSTTAYARGENNDGGWIEEVSSDNTDDPYEDVEESLPSRVALSSMKPYTYSSPNYSNPYDHWNDQYDIFGRCFQDVYYPNFEKYEGESSCTYRLGRQFSSFEFTLAIVEFQRGNATGAGGSMYIYGDGELLFLREGIRSDHETETLTISVAGVKDLRIELYADKEQVLASVNPMMCDPVLYR